MARKKKSEVTPKTETYQHPTATVLMRPEMGTQAQFRKHKKPAQYRFDPSLDPALSWDEGGAAWENLQKELKAEYAPEVWDHLAGTVSAPFEAGEHGRIAVKAIDDRGNERMAIKDLKGGGR